MTPTLPIETAPAVLNAVGTAAAKGAAVLGVAAVGTAAMRRSTAAARHGVWTLAVAVALLLPVAAAVVPAWPLAVLPAAVDRVPIDGPAGAGNTTVGGPGVAAGPSDAGDPPVAIADVARRRPGVSWPGVVLVVWAAGVAVVTAAWGVGAAAATRLARSATAVTAGPLWEAVDAVRRQVGVRRRVAVRVGGRVTTPLAAGIVRPKVLLPADVATWQPGRLQPVLLHELAHVKRHDCATQLLAHLCCCVHWFDPLAWVAAARLRAERERACDDAVLRHGAEPAAYAELLVSVAAAVRGSIAALPMARRSGLRGRVAMVLDGAVPRRPVRRRAAAVGLAVAVVLLAVTAAVRLAERPRPLAALPTSRPEAAAVPASTASLAIAPPVVVRTEPAAGADDVDPGTTELRVTFSKPMATDTWSWVRPDPDRSPAVTGRPRFLPDGRTCVLPVRLAAGREYAVWVNDDDDGNFADADGRAGVPYLLVFGTRR